MSRKFTPWFLKDNPPFRSGVYNVSCQEEDQSGDGYAWIEVNPDGDCLCSISWCFSAEKAEKGNNYLSSDTYKNHVKSWRGIIKE